MKVKVKLKVGAIATSSARLSGIVNPETANHSLCLLSLLAMELMEHLWHLNLVHLTVLASKSGNYNTVPQYFL